MSPIDVLYVIDDDEVYQYLTTEIIESTELVNTIKVFSNGAEAINYLKSIKDKLKELPQVIFLDLFMPVMNGWHFLDEFMNLKCCLNKKITIYIVSSSIDPKDIKRAQEISIVSDFIIKPITHEKFLKVIEEIVK